MREEERLKKIRDVLLKRKKATWTEIQKETTIPSKELSYDLKKLLRKGEVIAEQDMKDRRKTWYMLQDEKKALTESKRFECIEFIQSMGPDVNFAEAKATKHGIHCQCSVFTNLKDINTQIVATTIANTFLPILTKSIELKKLKTKEGFKGAYVITLETTLKEKRGKEI